MSEWRMHSSIWSSFRRSHSCHYRKGISPDDYPRAVLEQSHHRHYLTQVSHHFEMPLLIFVSVWHNHLRTLLCKSIDKISTQEASAAEYSGNVAGDRRTAAYTVDQSCHPRRSIEEGDLPTASIRSSLKYRLTCLSLDNEIMDAGSLLVYYRFKIRARGDIPRRSSAWNSQDGHRHCCVVPLDVAIESTFSSMLVCLAFIPIRRCTVESRVNRRLNFFEMFSGKLLLLLMMVTDTS